MQQQQQITVVWRNTGIRIPQEFFKSILHRETVRYYIRKKTGVLGYRQVFLRNPEDKEELKLSEFSLLTPGTRIFLKDAFDANVNKNNGNNKSNVDSELSGNSETIDSDIQANFEFLDFKLDNNKNDEKIDEKSENANHELDVNVNAELLCEIQKLHMSIGKLKRRLRMCEKKSKNHTKRNENSSRLNSNLFYLFLLTFFASLNIVLICVYFNSMILETGMSEAENYNSPEGVETLENLVISSMSKAHCSSRIQEYHENHENLERREDKIIYSEKSITSQENDHASTLPDSRLIIKIVEKIEGYIKGVMIVHAFVQLFSFI